MSVSRTSRRNRALIALIWLSCGLLALLTPLAWPNRVLGFTVLFWLICAPACLLLVLQPRLPLQLLAARRNHRMRR